MKKLLAVVVAIALVIGCFVVGTTLANNEPVENTTVVETESEVMPDIKDTHSDDGRTVVGISMPDRLLERWNRDGIFLRDQFEKDGCEVKLSYANNLIDTQIDDILTMIKEGADLLVIAAVDGAALGDALDVAKKANVPVIAYDRLIMDTEVVDYYVSFDNYKVGVLQAEYLIRKLNLEHSGRTKYIEFVSGDPVDNNARYFYSGAMDTLQPYIDKGKLVSRSGQHDFYETSTSQWSTDLAQQRLQIILNSYYPDKTRLDAVLCANDSTALGATRALEADYTGGNIVAVTGQDGDIANIYNIFAGTQGMTVFKALQEESVVTVALGRSLLKGDKPDESLIADNNWDFKCSFNTTDYDNGQKVVSSYLLEPVAVTAYNIEELLFDSGYYSRNSSGLIYAVK